MMTKKQSIFFTLLVIFLMTLAAQAQNITIPKEVLGFNPAEDRKLADWAQITAYFKKLDASSPRVELRELGQSTLKRPYIVAFI
jgi:hypothetical protein